MTEFTNFRKQATTKRQRKFITSRMNAGGGFTLTELAIVLVIIAFLTGGMLVPLSAQRDIQNTNETQKQLATINEALLGFAAANGRFPCPASTTSAGEEAFCTSEIGPSCTETTALQTHGRCAVSINGFVPGASLGVRPVDSTGRTIDGSNNPIRYSVFSGTINSITFAYTRQNGMQNAQLSNLGTGDLLFVCNSYPGVSPASNCGSAGTLTKRAAAVLLAQGKNGATTSTNDDELSNTDGDPVFVSHPPTPSSGTDPGFDDLVTWISPNVLFNRMIAAGRLP